MFSRELLHCLSHSFMYTWMWFNLKETIMLSNFTSPLFLAPFSSQVHFARGVATRAKLKQESLLASRYNLRPLICLVVVSLRQRRFLSHISWCCSWMVCLYSSWNLLLVSGLALEWLVCGNQFVRLWKVTKPPGWELLVTFICYISDWGDRTFKKRTRVLLCGRSLNSF